MNMKKMRTYFTSAINNEIKNESKHIYRPDMNVFRKVRINKNTIILLRRELTDDESFDYITRYNDSINTLKRWG